MESWGAEKPFSKILALEKKGISKDMRMMGLGDDEEEKQPNKLESK